MKNMHHQNRILFPSPTVQAGWERQSVITDFQIIKKLGSGSFGTVRQVKHKKSQKTYAIKEIQKANLKNRKLIEHARTQIKIMYSLNNPHIIKLYNHFEDQLSIFLVLQFAPKGHLYSALRQTEKGSFPQAISSQYIRQIASGIAELHRNKIMHRDIKLQNILLGENSEMKIADFGWSHFQTIQERTTFCGTLDYLAPQMLKQGHKHDYRVDLWSIGVLIYELCTGSSPFSCELIKNKNLTEENVKTNIKNLRYLLPDFLSSECKDLIQKLLVADPLMRLQALQILKHPWITKNSKYQDLQRAQSKKWLQILQDQVRSIFPEDTIQTVQNQQFTKQQIYEYSRPDSIINLKPQKILKKTNDKQKKESPKIAIQSKHNNQKQLGTLKKMSELQLRVAELQMLHKRDQDEINRLKNQNEKYKNHFGCQTKINDLMEQIDLQNRQLATFNHKLAQSESRLRTYEQRKY